MNVIRLSTPSQLAAAAVATPKKQNTPRQR